LVVLAGLAGFAIGVVAWATASHFVATSLNRAEERYPELTGSKKLRAFEITACTIVFLSCLALASWSSWFIWLQMR
jgi:hypothetical protein